MQPWGPLHPGVYDLHRPVGRAVVDHQHLGVPPLPIDARHHPPERLLDARALIVRGNHDAQLRSCHSFPRFVVPARVDSNCHRAGTAADTSRPYATYVRSNYQLSRINCILRPTFFSIHPPSPALERFHRRSFQERRTFAWFFLKKNHFNNSRAITVAVKPLSPPAPENVLRHGKRRFSSSPTKVLIHRKGEK